MSTILSADDLNDFIAPGAACIKPVELEKTSETAAIEIGPDGAPLESVNNETVKLQTAQISLTDCLACSGCITSAEAVLVELQSPKELLRVLKEEDKVFVVSISPQSRASLANAFALSIEQVDNRLMHLFIEKLGFRFAVGTELGRAISLQTSFNEASESHDGPILSSICPGWTLYVEKTHPYILPYLSKVKSPQQITGNLLKRYASDASGVPLEKVYHVSVMPCFDKKLESARPDNIIDQGVSEVDIVITAKEIVQMLQDEYHMEFSQLSTAHNYSTPLEFELSWSSNLGSSSGGYLWYILKNIEHRYGAQIEEIPGKNSDIIEYIAKTADGQVVWRGAQIYGFRNIQNLVRKLKPGKRIINKRATDPLSYNYVEIMACPGGCTNGGGQIGAKAGVAPKSWHQSVEEVYRQISTIDVFSAQFSHDVPTYTEFKPVEKDPSIPEALAVGSQW